MKKELFLAFALSIALFVGGASRLSAQDQFEVGAQVAVHRLPELGETLAGYGFRFTYNGYPPFLALDSEINFFPTDSTGNLGETQVFAGLKAGVHVGRWGAFAKLRPGFARFGGGASEQRLTGRTNFALDIGGVFEYRLVPQLALRWDLSDVMTDFGSGVLLAPPGPVGMPLHGRHNFETTVGLVLHF